MLSPDSRILQFARALARASTFRELFEATLAEVETVLGYRTIWFAIKDTEDATFVRVVDIVGANSESILENISTIPIAGDAMLQELFDHGLMVVVEDARTDPRTNKDIVAALGNRTIINVPLAILDKPYGALGVGTFGDEGCRPPTRDQLSYLMVMGSFVSVAASRLRLEERTRMAERERRELDRKLARMQRLDSIGVLAGGVAHDFNNLLTVLYSATSLARSAKTPEDVERELAAIESVAERGQALTQQLLAMSKGHVLSLQDFDLGAQLEQLVPLLRRVIPESITIDLINAIHEVYVEGDRTQLDQVVMNLCLNARDAMPEGGRITIETEIVLVNGTYRETHPWAKPGRYVLITISDTGHGIAKEHLDRIFDPFFTTKGEQAGTGLGLSVAHGIVRQHQGMLHCYSEVNIGTSFKIYLPLLARAASLVGPKIESRVQGGNERILVGEDDEQVRGVARRILQRAGYNVALVNGGDEVLSMLQADEFDLLLLDVVMPGPACGETLKRARALRPNLRVLLASGYTADINVADLLRDEKLQLLRKPYDPDALLRAIRSTLDARRV